MREFIVSYIMNMIMQISLQAQGPTDTEIRGAPTIFPKSHTCVALILKRSNWPWNGIKTHPNSKLWTIQRRLLWLTRKTKSGWKKWNSWDGRYFHVSLWHVPISPFLMEQPLSPYRNKAASLSQTYSSSLLRWPSQANPANPFWIWPQHFGTLSSDFIFEGKMALKCWGNTKVIHRLQQRRQIHESWHKTTIKKNHRRHHWP